MDGGGDKNEASACSGADARRGGWISFGRFEEMRQASFGGIVGAENIDVDDGFESVGREGGDWRQEIPSCTSSTSRGNCQGTNVLLGEFQFERGKGANHAQ